MKFFMCVMSHHLDYAQCDVVSLAVRVSVCLGVCESYAVHYLNDPGLCCAPVTCVVHHGAQGRPMSKRSRSRS